MLTTCDKHILIYFVMFVFSGIAAGTLIYVVVFEVLAREKTRDVSGLIQLVFVVLGFCTILMVEIFGHHDHGGEGDHDHHKGEALAMIEPAEIKNVNIP
jgi:zinc transporter 1/2/3